MAAGTTEPSPEEIRPEDLAGLFAVPQWLRDLGLAAWLLVGVTLLLVGGVWLLALTQTIVLPVLTASIVAAVLSPVMALLHRHGVPRGAGAALVMLTVVVAALAMAFLIVAGIADQAKGLTGNLSGAADKLRGYLQDAGVSADTAQNAETDASASLSDAFHAL